MHARFKQIKNKDKCIKDKKMKYDWIKKLKTEIIKN